jgi:hypothetical protein
MPLEKEGRMKIRYEGKSYREGNENVYERVDWRYDNLLLPAQSRYISSYAVVRYLVFTTEVFRKGGRGWWSAKLNTSNGTRAF